MPGLVLAQTSRIPPPEVQRWRSIFQTIAEQNESKLLVGDMDGYLAAFKSAAKADDWVSQLIAGDAVYRVSPAAAIQFHEAATRLAPDEGVPHLELAFDYQRTGQCERAIPAWQTADRLKVLISPSTAVAAYCFFRANRIDEALALWARVQWPGHRVSLDFSISEMAIGTQALDTHIDAYAKARAGDEKAFRTLIRNALDWRRDWWNSGINQKAFDAVRELAKSARPSDARLQHELACANDASSAKDADALLSVLRRCHLLIEDGELPASSEIAKFLLARVDALKAVPLDDFRSRHEAALQARAKSAAGDLTALEILAFLQVQARDYSALRESDELGWRRYHVAKFAISRLAGARADKQVWETNGKALLEEALRDFPLESYLHKLRYESFPPAPAEREGYLLAWIFAEYAGLSRNTASLSPLPTSTPLASVVYTLRTRREEGLNAK